jgi:hypothetical protein
MQRLAVLLDGYILDGEDEAGRLNDHWSHKYRSSGRSWALLGSRRRTPQSS